MRNWILCAVLIGLAGTATAEETLLPLDWSDIKEAGRLQAGEVMEEDGQEVLRIQRVAGDPQTGPVPVVTIHDPGITAATYALRGDVRYEAVTGEGYLEMWNHIPEAGKFFSRTLSETGPMGTLTGDSGWRKFLLPFQRGDATAPTQLDLNVMLPGTGQVDLRNVVLVQDVSTVSAIGWWSTRDAGLIGGLGGAVLGSLFGVLGMCVQRRKGLATVRLFYILLLGAGAAIAVGGLIAFRTAQPQHVGVVLLLMGGLTGLFAGMGLAQVKAATAADELRRMDAMDVA